MDLSFKNYIGLNDICTDNIMIDRQLKLKCISLTVAKIICKKDNLDEDNQIDKRYTTIPNQIIWLKCYV